MSGTLAQGFNRFVGVTLKAVPVAVAGIGSVSSAALIPFTSAATTPTGLNTLGWFDNTNSRLKPTSAVTLGLEIGLILNASPSTVINVWKNGTSGTLLATSGTIPVTTQIVLKIPQVTFNGTTDYVEVRRTVTGSTQFVPNDSRNYFKASQETNTFKAPAGVTEYIIGGVGCGGPGMGYDSTGSSSVPGLQGGSSSLWTYRPITLVPNTTYTVFTPVGSSGGNNKSYLQSNTYNATFGSLLTFYAANSLYDAVPSVLGVPQNGILTGGDISWFTGGFGGTTDLGCLASPFNGYYDNGALPGIGGTSVTTTGGQTFGGSGGNSELELLWVE